MWIAKDPKTGERIPYDEWSRQAHNDVSVRPAHLPPPPEPYTVGRMDLTRPPAPN